MTESQLQVAVTGTLAGVAVSASPSFMAWVGAALLVVATLRYRPRGQTEATLPGLRLTTAYCTIHFAALYISVVCEAARHARDTEQWIRYAVVPGFIFFIIHMAASGASLLWAESKGVRALTRSLPWVYLSAWLFSRLFVLH